MFFLDFISANKGLLSVWLLSFCLCAVASAQGIRFEEISWEEAKALSAKTAKPIFMDAHTSWCGPCKLLAKNVFTNESVAAFYNEHFVNLKMDMEKGEGPQLAAQFGIDVYPTLVFFDAGGNMIHRSAGYHAKDEFIALGKTALDPTNNFAGLIKRYNSGERTPGLLLALGKIKAAAYDPSAAQLINDYLKSQGDLSSPENMDVVFQYVDDPFSEGFKFLIQNKPVFVSKYGEKQTETKIESVFENYLMQHPELQLGEVQRLYGVCYPERGAELASSYRMTYYRQRSDMANFAKSAVDHYRKYPSDDADELNEMAWLFWQNVSEPDLLKTAEEWAQKSIKIQESWYNNDTLARIYQKTGKNKQAIKAAKRAIEVAAQTGEDASQTQELLNTLKN